jgi:hypothetical protein
MPDGPAWIRDFGNVQFLGLDVTGSFRRPPPFEFNLKARARNNRPVGPCLSGFQEGERLAVWAKPCKRIERRRVLRVDRHRKYLRLSGDRRIVRRHNRF